MGEKKPIRWPHSILPFTPHSLSPRARIASFSTFPTVLWHKSMGVPQFPSSFNKAIFQDSTALLTENSICQNSTSCNLIPPTVRWYCRRGISSRGGSAGSRIIMSIVKTQIRTAGEKLILKLVRSLTTFHDFLMFFAVYPHHLFTPSKVSSTRTA